MLEALGLTFGFPGPPPFSLNDISLRVDRGEIVGVLGQSGSGKTTLVKLLGGLLPPTSRNQATCDGEPVSQPSHEVGIVFQDYRTATFPWLTVRENMQVGAGASARNGGPSLDKASLDEMIEHEAEFLRIKGHLDKYPSKLSGGEVQRVQLGRALVAGVKYLLLDEPTSSLDLELRAVLNERLCELAIQREMGLVLVSHYLDEAVFMSDRLYIMKPSGVGTVGVMELKGFARKAENLGEALRCEAYQDAYASAYASLFGTGDT